MMAMQNENPAETGHHPAVDISDEDWRLARLIFSEFEHKPGSERIASEFALAHLSAILTFRRPRSVLELGAGIGTITKLLVTHPCRPNVIVATEDNEFCIGAFRSNLEQQHLDFVTLVTNLEELLDQDQMYDLAICDGGFSNKAQFKGTSEETAFFFEGHRGRHRRLLCEYLAENNLSYTERSYPQPGIKLFLKKNPYRFLGVSIAKPKIKRNKGCWIGSAHISSDQ